MPQPWHRIVLDVDQSDMATVTGHLRIDVVVQKPPDGPAILGIEAGLGHGVAVIENPFDRGDVMAQGVFDAGYHAGCRSAHFQ
jgi:hypothetical protein